jgi:hypothetical protein
MSTARIESESIARYGVSVAELAPNAALWLAEHLSVGAPAGTGWRTWRRIAAIRERAGRGTTFPDYGSLCFSA